MRQAGSERAKIFSEQLRTALMSGRHPQGSRLPPIRALAEDYDLTPMVVRLAIQRLEEEGLLESRHGSGVFVKALPPKPVIGVVTVHSAESPGSLYFVTSCALRLQELARTEGWETRLYMRSKATPSDKSIPDPELSRDIACGLLRGCFAFHSSTSEPWVRTAFGRQTPVVAAGEGFPLRVGSDRPGMIKAAVDMIVSSGRRRVAFVRWSDFKRRKDDNSYSMFSAALTAHGLTANPAWIPESLAHPTVSGEGARMFRELWNSPERPDSVIFADDILFRDACFEIVGGGVSIPDDLRVVTLYNKGSGIPVPFPVTLLQFDPTETAEAMFGIMRDALRDGIPPGGRCRRVSFQTVPCDGFRGFRVEAGRNPAPNRKSLGERVQRSGKT